MQAGRSPVKKPPRCGSNDLARGFVGAPEGRTERNRSVLAVDSQRWRVEEMKAMGCHARDNFCIYTSPRPRFPDTEQPGRTRHGGQYGIDVQRLYRAKID